MIKTQETLNGFGLRSWADLSVLLVVLGMLITLIVWGVRLETKLDFIGNKILKIESKIESGVLPIADLRISNNTKAIQDLRTTIDAHEQRDADLFNALLARLERVLDTAEQKK